MRAGYDGNQKIDSLSKDKLSSSSDQPRFGPTRNRMSLRTSAVDNLPYPYSNTARDHFHADATSLQDPSREPVDVPAPQGTTEITQLVDKKTHE